MTALVRAASLTSYVSVARRVGLNPQAMMRKSGIDPATLENPDLRIPVSRVVSLLEASARESGCPTIGIQMAESRQLSDFGALSLLLTHQPTLRDVLATLVLYVHVQNEALAVQVEVTDDLAVIRVEIVADRGGITRQANELALGATFRICRALLGPNWKPHAVHFNHAAPMDLSVHRRLFGLNPTFGGLFNGIVCAAEDLVKPNPSANPVMARYAGEFVETMHGAASPCIVQEVRKAIHLHLPVGRATIEQVADGLGMNTRTLQRHLGAAGEVFSDLLNGVRRDIAARYLCSEQNSLTEISAMLGFSHSSTFTRWHRAQFGLPPQSARAGAASVANRRTSTSRRARVMTDDSDGQWTGYPPSRAK